MEYLQTILVVEDEPSLVFTLRDTLESEHYNVDISRNGQEALRQVHQKPPALLILDIMLPGISGYQVCEDVRRAGYTFPIIMLTAKDQEADKVKGLNIGADDYLTKPFSVKELLARIRARLRRINGYNEEEPSHTLSLESVHIDLKNGKVKGPFSTQMLNTREIEMIQYFNKRPNQPVSREELLKEVWRYDHATNTRTVDVHISKLRSKIEANPEEPQTLVTLHGIGYMLKKTTG